MSEKIAFTPRPLGEGGFGGRCSVGVGRKIAFTPCPLGGVSSGERALLVASCDLVAILGAESRFTPRTLGGGSL